MPLRASALLFEHFRKSCSKYYSTSANIKLSVMSLYDVVKALKSFAPLHLAESWDNVGLLVDPMTTKTVKTILLTNDLTEDVVDEAVKLDARLIVSYHPNIFQGLKTVSSNTWKERIVIQCIKHEIAVFSPHTSWDSVEGGVNDWLASPFNANRIKPIKERPENPRQGAGRFLELNTSETLESIIGKVKSLTWKKNLRVAFGRQKGTLDSLVKTIALCAGSGSSVLREVDADLYLTGEMSHHEILDAVQKGIHVILCEHSNSERGFLGIFQKHLKEKLLPEDVNVVISDVDMDPIVIL